MIISWFPHSAIEFQPGTILVTIVKAKFNKDKGDLIGKQDPYCWIVLGNQKYRTKTDKGAGKKPKWKQTFSFEIKKSSPYFFSITCRDEDVGEDDLLGQAKIDVKSLQVDNCDIWVPISGGKKHKKKGEMQIKAKFTPKQKSDNSDDETE